MKKLINANGKSWTRAELKKTLGPYLLNPQETSLLRMKCPFNETHKSLGLNDEIKDGQLLIYAYCRECAGQIHEADLELPSEDVLEIAQKKIFNWLKARELVDGRWLPHTNPFDLSGDSPSLTYLNDSEGAPFLYNAAIHILYGKPGTLKSWLALSAIDAADVRFWDFENGPFATRDRLEKLNVTREKCDGYTTPASADEVFSRVQEYVETLPEVVVIDGFSGLAETLGINPESNNEVMTIFNKVLFPLRTAGICVLVLDHLPKDAASEDFPIGAQAKKAQSDVAILVKQKAGAQTVQMLVAKDRFGQLSRRCEEGPFPRNFGQLYLQATDESVKVVIAPSYKAEISGKELSTYDANQMKDIWTYIEKNPGCTKSDIEASVIGKHDRKRKNLQSLVDEGYVSSSKVATALIHKTLKPLSINWTPLGA